MKVFEKYKIFNPKFMITSQSLIHYTLGAFLLLILWAATYGMLTSESPAETARKTAERIAGYDYMRDDIKKENERKREEARKVISDADACDTSMDSNKGKDEEPMGCPATATGTTSTSWVSLIPTANADESKINTWTVTTAISVVPQWFERTKKDEVIMENICSAAPNSPLCGKWELYARLKDITLTRLPEAKYGRMWEILLGISFAESHLGQNMAKDNVGGRCFGRNNLGGTKYQINDDNSRSHSRQLNGFNYGAKYTSRYEDQYGCNLYPFQSYEEYWETKVNGMRYGYPSCIVGHPTPITCISYRYVGNPRVAEPNWIRNVASFLVTDEMLNAGQP